MKRYFILMMFATAALLLSCNKKEKNNTVTNTQSFGEPFKYESNQVISKKDLLKKYNNIKPGDSIDLVFTSDVQNVCKKKGCWMSMSLDDDSLKTFVRFKNYGFFMPLDADSSCVATVKGKAFVDVVSIANQKEYLKDAGKSQKEIDAITTDKKTFTILANGVQLSRK